MEAALIVLGALVLLSSFLIASGKDGAGADNSRTEQVLPGSLPAEAELVRMKGRIENELERGERELEKLTNEKIMAVEEYSGAVLEQIARNHQESMFLYDMLNEKYEELKKSLRAANISGDKKDGAEAARRTAADEGFEEGTEQGFKQDSKQDFKQDSKQGRGRRLRQGEVLEMGRAGYTELEIAQKLEMGVGEVRLILTLCRESARPEENRLSEEVTLS